MCRNLFVISCGLLLLFLFACQDGPDPNPLEVEPTIAPVQMSKFENENSFDILYPGHWTNNLMGQGMMVFGLEDTLYKQEPGPMVLVLRVPTAKVHGNLDGEFRHFLDFGPLREGYQAVGEVRETEIDGRPAYAVELNFEGIEAEGADFRLPMQAYIAGVEADNGAVYILSGTVPVDQWSQNEQAIKVMVSSITLNE